MEELFKVTRIRQQGISWYFQVLEAGISCSQELYTLLYLKFNAASVPILPFFAIWFFINFTLFDQICNQNGPLIRLVVSPRDSMPSLRCNSYHISWNSCHVASSLMQIGVSYPFANKRKYQYWERGKELHTWKSQNSCWRRLDTRNQF